MPYPPKLISKICRPRMEKMMIMKSLFLSIPEKILIYSCILRQPMKLKSCIITKQLKIKVKCLEVMPVFSQVSRYEW